MNKKIIVKILLWLLVAAWMLLIFSFSAEPAEESSETSGRLVRFICSIFEPDLEELSPEEQFVITERYQFYIRKTAHFCAYTMLGILIATATAQHTDKMKIRLGAAFVGGVAYSISDEIHQVFVPGRSGEVRDVLIDSSGVILGCVIVYIIFVLIRKKKLKKEKRRLKA